MIRIPIPVYDQTTRVSGAEQSRASPVQVGDPIGAAIGKVGDALQSDATALAHEQAVGQRILQHQQEEDAKAYAGKVVSDAHVQWQETLQKRIETAPPGATGFTPAILKDYDDYAKAAIEAAPTQASKDYLNQHLMSYRTQLAGHAISFESQARVGMRINDFSSSVDNWSKVVAQDPSKYGLALASLEQTMPAVGPMNQDKLREQVRKSLIQSAAAGQIQSDPEAAYNALTKSTLPPEAGPARDKTGTIDPVMPSGTRGLRNNNPGNIVRSDITWQGKTDGNDPRFETFETPEAGIRAMSKNLISYQDNHGRTTVQSIISAWAPASENNTAAYVANVSKALGVDPNAKIDVKDPATMKTLVSAIITQENGKQPYSDAQLNTGIGAAFGTAELPKAGTSPVPVSAGSADTKTGVPWIDAMNVQERLHYLQAADGEVRRRQQIARSDLELKERDQNAQALAGRPVANPLSLPDYVRAYGQVDGPRRYGEYTDNQQFGQNVQQVAILSPGEQKALLDKNVPVANSPGFYEDQKRYDLLQRAVVHANKERAEDPLGFAASHNLAKVNPINFTDPQSIQSELSNRATIARDNSKRWGVDYQVLTKQEAEGVGTYLESLQAQDKARVLGQIYNAAGPQGLLSISGQLKDKHDTLAIAGSLASRETTAGRNVAALYLEGKEMLSQKRAKIDDKAETGLKAEIYKAIDGVYMTPQARDAAADVSFAVYAKLKTDGTDDRERAIRIATGGIMDLNGAKIAKPYGMSDTDFRTQLATQGTRQVNSVGTEFIVGDKRMGAVAFAASLPGAKLQTFGDGTYLVKAGADVVRQADGRPFVLKITTGGR